MLVCTPGSLVETFAWGAAAGAVALTGLAWWLHLMNLKWKNRKK